MVSLIKFSTGIPKQVGITAFSDGFRLGPVTITSGTSPQVHTASPMAAKQPATPWIMHTDSAAGARSPCAAISFPRRVAQASERTGSPEMTVAISDFPKLSDGPTVPEEEHIPMTPSVCGILRPKQEVGDLPV